MKKRIAIIGSGISGLGASYLLNQNHDITIFEKENYVGGHSRTVEVKIENKTFFVDTGFIVFNKKNYPLLSSLFEKLEVIIDKSRMSFGISINQGQIEYGTESLRAFFSQKSNLLKADFWKMVFDILKFNRLALQTVKHHPNLTLKELIKELKLGNWFCNYYLLAMGGAIWSTPASSMLDFPAQTFVNFFNNHGLLTVFNQPQWYTVTGGSKEYVKKITADFSDKILLNSEIKRVIRDNQKVTLIDAKGGAREFDEVVFACHSDQALKMIDKPTADEIDILGSIAYQKNLVILHGDVSLMPVRKKAWSSWTYINDDNNYPAKNQISLSYWMNNLQNIDKKYPIIVSLNPKKMPRENLVYNIHEFDHPVFDQKAIQAQNKIDKIQGRNNSWFCGAYQKFGFHEDGLRSAVLIAEKMEVKRNW